MTSPRGRDDVALNEMARRLEREAATRRRRDEDDDDDGGALVPARPKKPGPKPLVGAATP